MQIGGHVGSKTGSGGRASHWLQGKVVHCAPPHAHISEVEVLLAQTVCTKQWFRGQIASESPWAGNWRGTHGGERRGHFHGEDEAVLGRAFGNECLRDRLGSMADEADG